MPNQAYSDTRGSSRAVSSVVGHTAPYGPSLRDSLSPDRVPSGSSHAIAPGAGSRAIGFVAQSRLVACRRVRRRIACGTARRPITCRHISARFGDFGVPAVFTVGRAERPSSAMPRPNSALEPTPPPAVYEHVFFSMAVPLYGGAFGGAAKRNRWAA